MSKDNPLELATSSAPRSNKRWEKSEDIQLDFSIRAGSSIEELATMFGRSDASIERRLELEHAKYLPEGMTFHRLPHDVSLAYLFDTFPPRPKQEDSNKVQQRFDEFECSITNWINQQMGKLHKKIFHAFMVTIFFNAGVYFVMATYL